MGLLLPGWLSKSVRRVRQSNICELRSGVYLDLHLVLGCRDTRTWWERRLWVRRRQHIPRARYERQCPEREQKRRLQYI